jgi:hypothetical protein
MLVGVVSTARFRQVVAVVAVTLISLAIIGTAAVTLTSAGCGVARSVGLTHVGGRCVSAEPVAGLSSPSPTRSPRGAASPTATNQPAPPPASNYPPDNPPASQYPPYNPPGSGYPPQGNLGSGYPFYPPTSAQPQLGLTCSLPVYAGPPGSGGFITFPGGTFIADPKSAVTLPTPAGASPTPPGYGPGYSGLTYSRVVSRWLPVQYRWVSQDAAHYAFMSGSSIYTVTIASGAVTELGEGKSWTIVDVRNEGVYAGVPNAAGLWLLPYTGSPRQIATWGFWQGVGQGFAYGTATSAVPQGAANTIVMLDLQLGTRGDVFSMPGQQSTVIGFDRSGTPIVSSSGNRGQSLWLLVGGFTPAPTLIADSSNGGFVSTSTPIADSNGIWFAGYSNPGGSAIVLAANSILYGMSTLGAQLAGGCS